jgi:hypothetical protein
MALRPRNIALLLSLVAIGATASSCARSLYAPERATRAYPFELHNTDSVDIQVFRDHEKLEIINATATSYNDVDIWINQRYVNHVESLPAGESVTLSLWEFGDQWGGVFNAGGVFRTYEPMPVRLVEIQSAADAPLVGLITIRAEDPPPERNQQGG